MRPAIKIALMSILSMPIAGWCSQLSTSASCEVNTGTAVVNCVPASSATAAPLAATTESIAAGIGQAGYGVRANYGDVGLYLNAATLASSGQVSTYADAHASAAYADEVLVTSNTLSVGTPTVVTVTLSIDGRARNMATSITGEVTASSYAYLWADYSVYQQDIVGPLLQFRACSATAPELYAGCSSGYDAENVSYTFSFDTVIGALLLVQGDLIGAVHADVGANQAAGAFPGNVGQVSALHSSHTYFTASGVDFIGASGHDYAIAQDVGASVPEPAPFTLLLAGLGACFFARRRNPRAC